MAYQTVCIKIICIVGILISINLMSPRTMACGAGFGMEDIELQLDLEFPWGLGKGNRGAPWVGVFHGENMRLQAGDVNWEKYRYEQDKILFNGSLVGTVTETGVVLEDIAYTITGEDVPCSESGEISSEFTVGINNRIIMKSTGARGCGSFGDVHAMGERIIGYLLWRQKLIKEVNAFRGSLQKEAVDWKGIQQAQLNGISFEQLVVSLALSGREMDESLVAYYQRAIEKSMRKGDPIAVLYSLSFHSKTESLVPVLLSLLKGRNGNVRTWVFSILKKWKVAYAQVEDHLLSLLKRDIITETVEVMVALEFAGEKAQAQLIRIVRFGNRERYRLLALETLVTMPINDDIIATVKRSRKDTSKKVSAFAKTFLNSLESSDTSRSSHL